MKEPKENLPAEIADALAQGRTVLTSNRRAARVLQRGFDAIERRAARPHWQPAAIFTLDDWALARWREMLMTGSASGLLLNRSQEHTIWRSIVAADKAAGGLRSTDALAEMAAEAWSLLCRYNGRDRLREIGVSTDTSAFQRWALAFERRCRRDLCLSHAQLWPELQAATERGVLTIPDAGLLLVGFDRIVPTAAAFFETIRHAGYAIDVYAEAHPQRQPLLVEAPEEREEIRLAAEWARQRLEADPAATVAIVVPALDTRRAELDRVFREVLAPEQEDIAADEANGRFEFSLGTSLAETGLNVTALQLLRWTLEPLELDRVSELLLSPFLNAGDLAARAEFDAFELRQSKLLRPEIALAWMISKTENVAGLGELAHRLRALHKAAAQEGVGTSSERTHADWAEAFRWMLRAAGWPGSESTDSLTFQMLRRWESALDELATLDFDGAHVRSEDALASLERIARNAIFAPESSNAPVQIMGPLEAAGQRFDALWFLGASDLGWPVTPSSSPLLPWHLQKELGMPGADSAADTALAHAIAHRLAHSAEEAIFSFAAASADGPQHASPLLAALNPQTIPVAQLGLGAHPRSPLAFESAPDDLELPPLPDRVHRGGVAILQAQAACGFRAFAEHRLWSTPLDTHEPGLDAAERGSLVHRVMEKIWSTLEDQRALQALTPAARERMLSECIDAGLQQTERRLDIASEWDRAYLDTQRARLHALLEPWLAFESQRPQFTVRETESTQQISVGPLQLDIRVDRVDETAGGLLIVDYKTGSASHRDWLSDRPDAPQLPLYALLAQPGELGGVAFALLRAGDDLELTGYAADNAVLAKPARMAFPSLDVQVADWRRVLTQLAEDFCAGDVRVAPKSYPKTCLFCAQRILCRINPGSLAQVDEDESEPDRG
jgi:ATP-dependent helicase/nuclease subunit B